MATIPSVEEIASALIFDNQRKGLERLVTKKELGELLALSQSFINELMSDAGLPYIKIGRAVRFRVSEIMVWLQKRRRP